MNSCENDGAREGVVGCLADNAGLNQLSEQGRRRLRVASRLLARLRTVTIGTYRQPQVCGAPYERGSSPVSLLVCSRDVSASSRVAQAAKRKATGSSPEESFL